MCILQRLEYVSMMDLDRWVLVCVHAAHGSSVLNTQKGSPLSGIPTPSGDTSCGKPPVITLRTIGFIPRLQTLGSQEHISRSAHNSSSGVQALW